MARGEGHRRGLETGSDDDDDNVSVGSRLSCVCIFLFCTCGVPALIAGTIFIVVGLYAE